MCEPGENLLIDEKKGAEGGGGQSLADVSAKKSIFFTLSLMHFNCN